MSRANPMSKSTITRLFVGGVVSLAVGLVLVLAAVWAAFASGLAVTVTLVALGSLAMLAGAAGAVVSWIGAVLNTALLEDKTWFVSLLVLGLCGVGVLAMAAYLLYGPDGTRGDRNRAATWPDLSQRKTEVQ